MSAPDLPYQMIVFDAGGTLIGADWSRVTRDLAAAAQAQGLRVLPDRVMQGLQATWRDVMVGRIADRADSREAVTAFWNHMLADALTRASDPGRPDGGEPYDPRAWQAARSFYPAFDTGDYHVLLDGSVEALGALLEAGYRLGLLSNWSPNLPLVLDRLDLSRFFEFVIVSALVGVAKPQRAIFDLAAERSGCQPHQLLYVGDSPSADVVGSRAAGWDAALLLRHGTGLDVPATFRVSTLSELVGLLTRT